MSEVIGGIVKKIYEKKTQRGVMYNVCLELDDGSEEWYGFGKYPPKFGEGSDIEFEVSYNGDFANVDFKSLEIIDLVEPAPAKPVRGSRGSSRVRGDDEGTSSSGSGRSSSAGRGGSRGGSRDASAGRSKPAATYGRSKPAPKSGGDNLSKDEWARKDAVIQVQAARNAAIALVTTALANDALPLPIKKADKLDAMVGVVDELTEQFFLDNDKVDALLKLRAEGAGKNSHDDEPPFDEDEDEDGLPGE